MKMDDLLMHDRYLQPLEVINFFVNETIKQGDLDIDYDNYAYNKPKTTSFVDKYYPNLPKSINKIDLACQTPAELTHVPDIYLLFS